MNAWRTFATTAALGGLFAAGVWAADTRRAPPPKFDPSFINDLFFPDAREQLGPGGPPVPGQVLIAAPASPAGMGAPVGGNAASPAAAASSDGNGWSKLVSADTLEGEVKAQPTAIDAAMKSTNQQKSSRMVVTYLATLFGVIFKYDQDVRWKDDSQAMRDSFARGGNNLKAWTDSQKKQVAKLKIDLTDLIGGNKPQVSTQLDAQAPWLEIADRPPLMHRLEMGQSERLNGWCKDADSVKRNADSIIREAEVMAMLARIIQDPSYEYSDDDTYLEFARALEQHAVAAVEAVKRGDGGAASSAVAQMQKACDDCHGGFR